MAVLGRTRYGIGVTYHENGTLNTVTKTYNGINFSSDAANVKASEAYVFVNGNGSDNPGIASLSTYANYADADVISRNAVRE